MKNKVVITAVLAGALALSGAGGAQAAGSTASAKYVNYVHSHDPVTRNAPTKTIKSLGKLICTDLRHGATKAQLIKASPAGATKKLMRVVIAGATKYLCTDV